MDVAIRLADDISLTVPVLAIVLTLSVRVALVETPETVSVFPALADKVLLEEAARTKEVIVASTSAFSESAEVEKLAVGAVVSITLPSAKPHVRGFDQLPETETVAGVAAHAETANKTDIDNADIFFIFDSR